MKIRKAENYEEIVGLLKNWFRPGVCTNNFLTAEDYRRELRNGALYYGLWQDGLLVLRKRESFFRVAYHFLPGGQCPNLPQELHAVMEIPSRPKDSKAEIVEDFWKNGGFVPVLERWRYRREKSSEDLRDRAFFLEQKNIVLAQGDRVSEALTFLKGQFDPATGCLPSLEELSQDTVFCLLDEQAAIAGVLHSSLGRSFSEIRHLAIREDFRGRGCGKALIDAYEKQVPSLKSLVWTGKDNFVARGLYEKCGYSPDGWTARVLRYGKEE